jgi:hypothetical protein
LSRLPARLNRVFLGGNKNIWTETNDAFSGRLIFLAKTKLLGANLGGGKVILLEGIFTIMNKLGK